MQFLLGYGTPYYLTKGAFGRSNYEDACLRVHEYSVLRTEYCNKAFVYDEGRKAEEEGRSGLRRDGRMAFLIWWDISRGCCGNLFDLEYADRHFPFALLYVILFFLFIYFFQRLTLSFWQYMHTVIPHVLRTP